jgi:hypothetical protein
MIIGSGFKRLEKRITTALYGGRLGAKETGFLQNMLRKVELYRDEAFVSDSQASWLFTILTNLEQGDSTKLRHRKSTKAPPPHSSPDQDSEFLRFWRVLAGVDKVAWTEEEKPGVLDLSKAIGSDSGMEVPRRES